MKNFWNYFIWFVASMFAVTGGARVTEQLDFSYVEDSVERYKIAEQHYQTVFWNSLDTVQKAYLNKIETY